MITNKIYNYYKSPGFPTIGTNLLKTSQNLPKHPLFPELTKPNIFLFSYKVQKIALNGFKSAHGGAIATLIDEFTTICISIVDKQHRGNLSVKLNVAYIKGCFENDEIFFLVDVKKVGRNLAYSTCEVFKEVEGARKVLYTGTHVKAFVDVSLKKFLPKL